MNMRYIGPVLAIASAVLLAAPAPPPPPAAVALSSSSVGAGPWIVAGVGVGVLSVMIRAAVVGSRQHRELTSEEAIQAVALPFLWVLYPPNPVYPPSPVKRQ
jgi:hypothetical protein